jgi:hypothetical protein
MKKLPITPKSRIVSALRRLSMYSRELNLFKKEHKTCAECGCSGKMEIHHLRRPNWDKIVQIIREELLDSNHLQALCSTHHAAHTKAQKSQKK